MLSRTRKLTKRKLPVAATGRRRTRHQITLSPDYVKRFAARSAAAKALGYRTNLSAEIERALDEAEGNLRSARHEFAKLLNPLRMHLFFVKSQVLSGKRLTAEDLKPMEDAVTKMAARLDPPLS